MHYNSERVVGMHQSMTLCHDFLLTLIGGSLHAGYPFTDAVKGAQRSR